jgi:hypothetical protein
VVIYRRGKRVETAADLGIRPFAIPQCGWCKAALVDEQGRPRWEVVGRLTFVCLGGCYRTRASAFRKARLS